MNNLKIDIPDEAYEFYQQQIHIPGTFDTTHSNKEFVSVTTVKNFLVDSGDRFLGGRYFVIDTEETSFFHFLFYHLGQFLFLREIFDDLKLLVAITDHTQPPYIQELMKIIDDRYSPEYFNVTANHSGIKIENLTYISNRLTPLTSRVGLPDADLVANPAYSRAISKILRGFIHQHVHDAPSEKIYISRRDVSDRTRKYRLLLDAMPKLGIVWDSNERIFFDMYGIYPSLVPAFAPGDIMPWHIEPEAHFRYLSEREEAYLENFFVDRGYRILDPGKEKLFQTLSSVFHSTHAASLTGSVAFNLLAASDDTVVFLINRDTRFEFDYDTAVDAASNHVFHVFDRRIDESERTSHDIDDVINAIIHTGKV
jgi:hypothetical protein